VCSNKCFQGLFIVCLFCLQLLNCSEPQLSTSMIRDSINDGHYYKEEVLNTSGIPSFGEYYREGNNNYGIIWDEKATKENIEKLHTCAQQHLISLSRVERQDYKGSSFFQVRLENKGKDFITLEKFGSNNFRWGTMKLAEVILIDVTNIGKPMEVMGQKRCTVEISYKYKATPFGEIYLSRNELGKILKKNITFILSEDGWKISPEGLNLW
jgi:hypothetical protein